MWAALGYQLVGTLLGGFAAAVLFWALFGDRLQGGHKRARCPKCGYDMAAANGSWTCPECGKAGIGSARLYRPRRRWRLALAMAACLILGLGVSAWPTLRRGWWQHHLPVLWHARLSPIQVALHRGDELLTIANSPTRTPWQIDELRSLTKQIVASPGAPGTRAEMLALQLLRRIGPASRDDLEIAKRALLVNDWEVVTAGIEFIDAAIDQPTERFNIYTAALAASSSQHQVQPLTEALLKLESLDSRVAPYLFGRAFDPVSGDRSQIGTFALLAPAIRYRVGMDALRRVQSDPAALLAMVKSSQGWCAPSTPADEAEYALWSLEYLAPIGNEAMPFWQNTASRVVNDENLSVFVSLAERLAPALRDTTVQLLLARTQAPLPLAFFDRRFPPEAVGDALTKGDYLLHRAPAERHAMIIDTARRLQPARWPLWTIGLLKPRSAAQLEFLRQVEGDKSTSEECRVAARDALRNLGEWTDKPAAPK